MQGLVLTVPGAEAVVIGREHGILFNCTADRVLRFLPPLNITMQEMDEGAARLRSAFADFATTARKAKLQQAGS
jgi:acetylornithine/succinyldiaminopimelate/putrescine aminotransferase